MQADHTRNARETEDELAQTAQVSSLALLAEVRLNVAGMSLLNVCTTLAGGVRTGCCLLHLANNFDPAVTNVLEALSSAGGSEDACCGCTTHAAQWLGTLAQNQCLSTR